jgi:hypothetical protein
MSNQTSPNAPPGPAPSIHTFPGVPNVIKIDVEGAELAALRGAAALLQSDQPPALIVEHNHVTSAAAGFTPADLFQTITSLQPRYRFYWIGARPRPIPTAEALNAISRQGNILIRDEPRRPPADRIRH